MQRPHTLDIVLKVVTLVLLIRNVALESSNRLTQLQAFFTRMRRPPAATKGARRTRKHREVQSGSTFIIAGALCVCPCEKNVGKAS